MASSSLLPINTTINIMGKSLWLNMLSIVDLAPQLASKANYAGGFPMPYYIYIKVTRGLDSNSVIWTAWPFFQAQSAHEIPEEPYHGYCATIFHIFLHIIHGIPCNFRNLGELLAAAKVCDDFGTTNLLKAYVNDMIHVPTWNLSLFPNLISAVDTIENVMGIRRLRNRWISRDLVHHMIGQWPSIGGALQISRRNGVEGAVLQGLLDFIDLRSTLLRCKIQNVFLLSQSLVKELQSFHFPVHSDEGQIVASLVANNENFAAGQTWEMIFLRQSGYIILQALLMIRSGRYASLTSVEKTIVGLSDQIKALLVDHLAFPPDLAGQSLWYPTSEDFTDAECLIVE